MHWIKVIWPKTAHYVWVEYASYVFFVRNSRTTYEINIDQIRFFYNLSFLKAVKRNKRIYYHYIQVLKSSRPFSLMTEVPLCFPLYFFRIVFIHSISKIDVPCNFLVSFSFNHRRNLFHTFDQLKLLVILYQLKKYTTYIFYLVSSRQTLHLSCAVSCIQFLHSRDSCF